ncbi:MAG: hypothetical protein J3R72DRAFT_492830 [Linnemannia gamsii]|nr:MAG: hypothetical protein J3R72DRAFT_492830 [Linnemannia gamsii]
MVKIIFSLLSIAAVVASMVSASPCAQDTFKGFDSYRKLNSIVSKEQDGDIVVGGIPGNKMFQELELCVVSTDAECNPPYPTNCIYENVDYRFRVNGPVKGYLRVVDNEASGLNLQQIATVAALRIGYKDHSGVIQVFSIPRAGDPIVVEEAIANKVSQWIQLLKTNPYKGRFNLW